MSMSDLGGVNPYAILLAAGGGSNSTNVNLLQDLGFSFTPNAPFQSQLDPYVGSAAPVFYSQLDYQYGNDDVAAYMFDAIDRGVAPDQAYLDAKVAFPEQVAAMEAGEGFGTNPLTGEIDPTQKEGGSYRQIALRYADERAAHNAKVAQYQADQAFAQSQHQAAVDRERAQYEASKPVTMDDIMRSQRSQYEDAYGGPLSADTLLKQYATDRGFGARGSAEVDGVAYGSPYYRPASGRTTATNMYNTPTDFATKFANKVATGTVNQHLNMLGTKQAYDPKVDAIMKQLAALASFSKDG